MDIVEADDHAESRRNVRSRGKIHFIDDRMLGCMDRYKMSTEHAVHFISATALALGHRLEDLVCNRTTIQNLRKDYRRKQAHQILNDFQVRNMLHIC